MFALWKLSRFHPLLVTSNWDPWHLEGSTNIRMFFQVASGYNNSKHQLFPLEIHVSYATGATCFNTPSDVISGSHCSTLGVSTADGTHAPWIWNAGSVVDCFWCLVESGNKQKKLYFFVKLKLMLEETTHLPHLPIGWILLYSNMADQRPKVDGYRGA